MSSNIELERIRRALRERLPALSERFGVNYLGVFGSQARGDSGPDSDVDVLVRFREAPSLFRFVELENELSDLLGIKVDLVMAESLKPSISRRVLQDVIPV